MGADIIRPLGHREHLGRHAGLLRPVRPGQGLEEGFARHRDQQRQAEASASSGSRPSTVSEVCGLVPRKKPMPGSRISRSGAMPASVSAVSRFSKKAKMRSKIASGGISMRVAMPCSCTVCITISLALEPRQLRIKRRIGKAVNVVEIIHALLQRPALHRRRETVDRKRGAHVMQRRDHRSQPRDLDLRRHRLRHRDAKTPRRYR